MMKNGIFAAIFIFSATILSGGEPKEPMEPNEPKTLGFPTPHYEPAPGDPAWLQTAATFHGHLGPAIVVGARLGMAGRAAVGAKGHFDVEIVCRGPFAAPPRSCLLDGVQLATGATLGKRNLTVVLADDYAVTIKNRMTGKTAVLRPKPEIIDLMLSQLHKDDDHDAEEDNHDKNHDAEEDDHQANDPIDAMKKVERIARQIAAMPSDAILTVE